MSIDPNVDPYGFLGVRKISGTFVRTSVPATAPDPDLTSQAQVLFKDVSINKEKNTFVRLYLPQPVLEEPTAKKLHLIFYYHGGGFAMDFSPASAGVHKFCSNLVEKIPSVLVSVGYRPAPEHRLPAAYDDCMEAVHWVRTTDEEWLTKYADFSKCFLMGTSAGGNIAYHVGLCSAACVEQLMPLKIKGLILHQPYFGGVERTPAEIRLMHDVVIPLTVIDICWELALPIGADRDHEYSNPIKHLQVEIVDKMKEEGWKFLVTGYDGDPLIDRQVEVAKMLRERGVDVMEMFNHGGHHGIEFGDEDKASILYDVIKNLILES